LPWNVLAAVGKVETDHGRSREAGVQSGHNSAGAMGPMQFEPGSWSQYGVDGNGDGRKDVYDPADAIPSAATMLCADGAREGTDAGIRKALYAYNHANWYVDKVLAMAATYATSAPTQIATAVLTFAIAQLGKPYVWGATGPDSFDCSGLTLRAYQAAGISIPRTSEAQWDLPHVPVGQEQPGDLAFYHPSPSGPGHVALVVDPARHLGVEAPHTGDVVKYFDYTQGAIGYARPHEPGD
jgi:cell wall-associated NlpC family hydrolase